MAVFSGRGKRGVATPPSNVLEGATEEVFQWGGGGSLPPGFGVGGIAAGW